MATTYTLNHLAATLNAKLQGDGNCQISSIAPLDKAQTGQISFLHSSQYRRHLATTQASAVILAAKDAADCRVNALIVDDPYVAYAKIAALFLQLPAINSGIHPTAVIGKDCKIGNQVSIGANCVIGDHVQIGDHVTIHPGCVIGNHVKIDENSLLWANVTVYYGVQIGKRAIIHSGVVIGSDGFGFANERGQWVKIPQLGGVIIGNDVEVGANTAIDRGAIEDTVIGNGVKIDNLVQVAHNVHIGDHTAIAGCVAIAGSAHIGKHCMIGGGSSIVGHSEITDGVILVGTSVVEKSLTEPGVYASGTGIMPFKELKRSIIRFRQLEQIVQRINKLEKAMVLEREQDERNGSE